nr:type IV pilus biogenesis/stability protein PilW [Rheinheimera maricola]
MCSLVALTGCVSEQSYVGSDKPVSDRTFDNIEAARTRISLGLNYLRRGDTSQAKYNLERARSFAPNSAEVYSAMAYYYQSVGENKQAEEYFRTAISKDSNYADAYNNYGAFLCQLNRYEEAEQLLLKAISRPGYIRVAESYENLAQCKLQQDNFNQAKSYLDSSISHNATRITSLILHAGLAYAMGDNPAAKRHLDRIQRLGRVSSRTVLLSYLIAEKSGDREVLRNAEQLLLTLYMDTPEARLLMQGKLESSEFELLRERYKDSLMANIVLPDETAQLNIPTTPVTNPQLKIVKRKATSSEQQPAQPPEQKPEQAAVAKIFNNTAGIADSFVKSDAAVASAATQAAALDKPLPVEIPGPTVDTDTSSTAVEEQQRAASGTESTSLANAAVFNAEPAKAVFTPETDVPVRQQHDAEVAMSDSGQPATTDLVAVELTGTEIAATESTDAGLTAAELTGADLAATESTDAGLADANLTIELNETDAVDTAVAEVNTPALIEPLAADELVTYIAPSTVNDAVVSDSADATAYHLVQEAESLYAISVKHNIRLQRLMQWNQLTPEAVIKTGQKIWLGPVSETELQMQQNDARPARAASEIALATTDSPYHVVSDGETMFGISYRYNVRLDKFLSWNNLSEQSTLRVGQQVVVVDPASIEP